MPNKGKSPMPTRSDKPVNESRPNVRAAVVDLFAGLRTVHVAAKGSGIEIVLSYAAEKCKFANGLAGKNEIAEAVLEDVKMMDKKWAKAFVEQSRSEGVQVIIVIGGFPCKGLSHARGGEQGEPGE